MQRPLMLALASAIALGFAAAAPASAAERALNLNYAALDLDDNAGVDALLRRIEHSAENACGERAGPMPLSQRAAIQRCVRMKSEQAVSDVGNANLTARFYNRNPRIIVASR